jgi:hypothetical protein
MAGVTKNENINVTAREIDFVTRFGLTWDALREIIGIMRPIRKEAGAILKSKKASVVLENGAVGEGETVPYSVASVVEVPYAEMGLRKYAKAVSAEAIKNHGYDVAVAMTDKAFLNELQSNVMTEFYSYLRTGELTNVQTSYQMALAMARGLVTEKFSAMNLSVTEIVGFVNILDVYEYLGAANITVQNKFGFQYIKDFMGYNTIFLVDSNKLPRGKVISTPVENIVMYYVDPSMSDFSRAGLSYTVQGETPLLGFHTQGNYNTVVSECFALMGVVLFSEYLDGIAVVDVVSDSATIGALTGVSTAAGTVAVGDSVVTLPTTGIDAGAKFYIKAQASTAPTAPDYLAEFDATGWTAVKNGDTISTTNGHKYRVVEVNGTNQVIATADGTVVAKAS